MYRHYARRTFQTRFPAALLEGCVDVFFLWQGVVVGVCTRVNVCLYRCVCMCALCVSMFLGVCVVVLRSHRVSLSSPTKLTSSLARSIPTGNTNALIPPLHTSADLTRSIRDRSDQLYGEQTEQELDEAATCRIISVVAHVRPSILAHACIGRRHAHSHTHISMPSHTYTRSQSQSHPRTHSLMHPPTRARTRALTYKQAHLHTHTTHLSPPLSLLSVVLHLFLSLSPPPPPLPHLASCA
jgi:hypothetical protein